MLKDFLIVLNYNLLLGHPVFTLAISAASFLLANFGGG